MMKRYLLGLVNQAEKKWQAEYEKRTTPEANRSLAERDARAAVG